MTASWCQLGPREYPGGIYPNCGTAHLSLGSQPCLSPAYLRRHRYSWERGQASTALSVTQDPARKKPLG